MKTLLTIAMLALLTSGAAALEDHELNMMGVFFSPTEFVDETTNLDTTGAPFAAYLVLLNPTVESVGGYEVSIRFEPPLPFVLSVTGENGWTNFGDNTNHLCGYQVPLPSMGYGVVLATFTMLMTGTDYVEIWLGPSDPASIPGVPVIADGSNPDLLIPCNCTTHDCMVATLNGDGVVATTDETWTSVKALFD